MTGNTKIEKSKIENKIANRSVLILGLVAFAVTVAGVVLLFKCLHEQSESQLLAFVNAQGALMESVAKSFGVTDETNYKQRSKALDVIHNGVDNYSGFGYSLVLGELQNNRLVYLQSSENSGGSKPVSVSIAASLDLPMKRALQKMSGVMETTDIDGRQIIAAYQYLPSLQLGLVAKMSRSEIIGPIRLSTFYSALIAVIFIVFGSLLNGRMVKPLIASIYQYSLQLGKSEEQFRTLVGNIPGVVYRSLPVEPWVMLFISQEIEKLSGYAVDDFMEDGEHCFGCILHPDDRQRLVEDTQLRIEEGKPYSREFRVIDREQRIHWILDKGQPVYEEGHPGFIDGTLFDITDMKNMQQELEQARDIAEEATRTKSDFLANMSHEIRTPMNAIIGLTHLALRTELTTKQRDYLSKTNQAANNLLGIINDILDFSKIEAGKMEMETVDFDLLQVLDNLSHIAGVKAGEKGLEFLFDYLPDLPTNLIGDPLRIGQILLNLVNNAVKFTEDGEITLHIEAVAQDGNAVILRFTVRDTGIGMNREQQSKLFHSFSQTDSSTTRKYGGTGLGLAISKQLVELMHGQIGVDSAPGEGSAFYFTARFGLSKQIFTKRSVVPEAINHLKVLVVDDHPTSREILLRELDTLGFEGVAVSSGEKALLELEESPTESPYRLVLMDWKMPEMDGLEASHRILNHPTLKTIPSIIIVSAYGHETLMEEEMRLGIAGHLVKPVNESTLFNAIMQAICGKNVAVKSSSGSGDLPVVDPRLRGAHLLLVEDNEINQQVAMELLQQGGLHVTIANNGKEAVDLVQQIRFDGVLMDLQMPVMDGLEATRVIRRMDEWKDLPIIAMTANAMSGDRDLCLMAGMQDHVAKPINPFELFETLARWVKASDPEAVKAVPPSAVITATGSLPVLPGIDVTAGLRRVADNQLLYIKILKMFKKSQADAVERIIFSMIQGDTVTARRDAHSLRGVAGNIGATGLYNAAGNLETAIAEERNIEEPLEVVRKSLSALIESLNLLPEERGESDGIATPSVAIDMALLSPLLEKLGALLREDDAEAIHLLEQIHQQMPDAYKALHLKRISKLVDQYAFEEAVNLFDQMLKEQQQGAE